MKYNIFGKKNDGSVESFGTANTINAATRRIINLSKKSIDLGYIYFYFLPNKEG